MSIVRQFLELDQWLSDDDMPNRFSRLIDNEDLFYCELGDDFRVVLGYVQDEMDYLTFKGRIATEEERQIIFHAAVFCDMSLDDCNKNSEIKGWMRDNGWKKHNMYNFEKTILGIRLTVSEINPNIFIIRLTDGDIFDDALFQGKVYKPREFELILKCITCG